MIERHIFLIFLWVSTALAVGAHATDGSSGLAVAVAIVAGLVVWVHGVHRCHRWTDEDHGTTRFVITTAGLYIGLCALVIIDAYLFMLFGVFSFTFGYCNDVRLAALLSGVLTAGWIGGWLLHDLPAGAILTPVFVWAVANAINVLTTRISNQNIERGELIASLTETRAELAQAERERGVLEERERLAREIHDTLAQGFTSVVLLAEATGDQIDALPTERVQSSLSLIASTARDNLNEARRLVAAETPLALDGRSLDAALRSVADRLSERTGISVSVDTPANVALGGSEELGYRRRSVGRQRPRVHAATGTRTRRPCRDQSGARRRHRRASADPDCERSTMSVSVLVADDHPVVRTGLVMMLSGDSGIEIIGEASNGREAIDLARQHRPDVVVMDLQMPELDGVEATRQIKLEFPDTAVLILTTFDTDRSIVAAVDADATGYLLKDAPLR